MAGKPSIMDEVARDALENRANTTVATKYCGEGDTLVLEDESGRLALVLPPVCP